MPDRLIGMVHLGALPGAPGYRGDLDHVLAAAVRDAKMLEEAGFDAVMVENFGDAPFFPDEAPKITVAAMARAVAEIRRAVRIPIGVNVLRNDALAALAVAAACGAGFIRVNVLSGMMVTDQGPVTGRAADLARARSALAPDVEILADVFVKHAVPSPGLSLEMAAADTFYRAGADALILSGAATGQAVDQERFRTVRSAVPQAPLLVGSGASADTIAELLTIADGAIVGTAVKVDGVTTNPIDPDRARRFVAAALGN